MIMNAAHVNRAFPKGRVPVKLFVEEFRTLFSIWRRLLLFRAHLPNNDVVPRIDEIREFTLRFTLPASLNYMTKLSQGTVRMDSNKDVGDVVVACCV
jgi:hypothetical protein